MDARQSYDRIAGLAAMQGIVVESLSVASGYVKALKEASPALESALQYTDIYSEGVLSRCTFNNYVFSSSRNERQWLDHSIISLQAYSSIAVALDQEFSKALDFLRLIMSILSDRYSEKYRLLCEAQKTFHLSQGLACLPDDVLSIVFKMVHEGESLDFRSECNRWKRAFSLAAVCRRFRHIAQQTPHLWSSISTTMRRPGIVSACLRNGGNCELSILVHPIARRSDGGTIDVDGEFVQETVVRQHRWAKLAILIERSTLRVRPEPLKSMLLTITHLPQLRVLSYTDPYNDSDQFLLLDNRHLLDIIIKAAPNLTSLCLDVINPRIPPMLTTATQSLTELELTGSRIPSDMEGFISSISRLQALVHLKLQLCRRHRHRNAVDTGPLTLLTTTHSFPTVKRLQLDICEELTYILSYIGFPNVSFMDLAVSDAQAVLDAFDPPKPYNHLTTIRLEVRTTGDTGWHTDPPPSLRNFSFLTPSCPILDDFTFSTFWSPSAEDIKLPSLRTLTVSKPLEAADRQWLEKYADLLRARTGAWEAFERLHVRMVKARSGGDSDAQKLREVFKSKLRLEWQKV